MGCSDDSMIYAVIPRLLSSPQVMESLNQDLAAIHSWCLKWHMRLNCKKTKFMLVSTPPWISSKTITHGYGDLTHYGAELEEV